MRNGRYDSAERRRSQREAREKGCWVYIPLAELEKTGHGDSEPPPLYRVWGSSRGRVVVQLYRNPPANGIEFDNGKSARKA